MPRLTGILSKKKFVLIALTLTIFLTSITATGNQKTKDFNPYVLVPPENSDFKTRHEKHICPDVPGVSICKSIPDFKEERLKAKQLQIFIENPPVKETTNIGTIVTVSSASFVLGVLVTLFVLDKN